MSPNDEPGAPGRVLADSSLWVEYYQPTGRPALQAAVKEAVAQDRVGTMAMILIEVLRGALTSDSYEVLQTDLAALHWLDVTPAVARRGAKIGFSLDRAGKRVPATDLLIAATAIEHGYALWHNDGHFEVIAENSELVHRRFVP
ncbi:MAG: PIN domain-containing protein [Gemmatimonadetes bacterium]|nr:PIN domain-containing protein [Gemmatimonadota bacterium]MBI2538118.1 PIN domain-containing protein [Gemmatimonadota bacterium]